MGTSKFHLEGLVLNNFLKKAITILCSTKIYIPCILLLIALTSACVDYIDIEKDSPSISENHNLEIKVFEEINAYRNSKNLPTLINSDIIAKVARMHSDNMATGDIEFGHTDSDKRFEYICEEIENAKGMAENVAYGYSTAESVSEGWVNSSGHKKNIEGDYTHTGVGIATSTDGTIYYTQIFIKTEE
jgi:uncharacterized protein YkwD